MVSVLLQKPSDLDGIPELTIRDPKPVAWHQRLHPRQEIGNQLGLIRFAVQVSGHGQDQPRLRHGGNQQLAARNLADGVPRGLEPFGYFLGRLAVENDRGHALQTRRWRPGFGRSGIKLAEAAGGLFKEAEAQRHRKVAEFAVDRRVSGFKNALLSGSFKALASAAFVLDEGIRDQLHKRGKGENLLKTTPPMCLKDGIQLRGVENV